MKRIITSLLVIAMLAVFTVSASAITLPDGDVLGYWKLDGNLKNDIGGPDAQYIGGYFAEPLYDPEDYIWIEGVDGYAWKAETSVKDGIQFVAPSSQSITFMEWVKSENFVGWTPLMFWGEQDQSNALGLGGEAWIGIWSDAVADWSVQGPSISSNDHTGTRIHAICPENPGFEPDHFPWTHIAMTMEYNEETGLSYGKLYFNGQLVAENDGFPYVQSDDSYIYFGANYWNWPITGYLDEVIIYNEALSDEDIAAVYAQYATPSEDVVEVNPNGTEDTEPVETEAPETKAPETKAPETKAPETQTPDTQAPEEKSGCGSAMGVAAAIVALAAAFGCAVVKKH